MKLKLIYNSTIEIEISPKATKSSRFKISYEYQMSRK